MAGKVLLEEGWRSLLEVQKWLMEFKDLSEGWFGRSVLRVRA